LMSNISSFSEFDGIPVVDGAIPTLDALARKPGRVAFADVPGHVSPDEISLALTVTPRRQDCRSEKEILFSITHNLLCFAHSACSPSETSRVG
jgi:hypothetical protein